MKKEIRKSISNILKEVFKIENIADDDNFFEMGMHSLQAAIFIRKITDLYEVELPISFLFKNPTLKKVCAHMEELLNGRS